MPTFDERPTTRSIRMCRHTGYFVGKPTRLASIMRLHLEKAGLEVREHQGDLPRRPAQVQEMLHHAQRAIRRDRARPHFGADTQGPLRPGNCREPPTPGNGGCLAPFPFSVTRISHSVCQAAAVLSMSSNEIEILLPTAFAMVAGVADGLSGSSSLSSCPLLVSMRRAIPTPWLLLPRPLIALSGVRRPS
jgi:hypothetical protein